MNAMTEWKQPLPEAMNVLSHRLAFHNKRVLAGRRIGVGHDGGYAAQVGCQRSLLSVMWKYEEGGER